MKLRVLVVEDEPTISTPLAEHLIREGFDAEVSGTIEDATRAWRASPPDLLLLDVMLPARGEEIDRIVGLELGADDYVVKPFSAGELIARMRAIMRRGRSTARKGPIDIGPIHLDPASRTVTNDGVPVELAAKEFDLLHMLMAN